jgi:hypothetical protein
MPLEYGARKRQSSWLSRNICASSEAVRQAREDEEVQAVERQRYGRSDIDQVAV